MPLQNFLLIGWLVFLPLKQIMKYKKPHCLPPGAGSFDEVTFWKVLPKSNKGNVQVQMFSNYSRSQSSFRGLCYSNDLVPQNFLILRKSWFDVGLVQARMFSSSGFTRLFSPEFCNRNAISWLYGFGSNNNLQMCEVLHKKGKVWENDLTNASVRSLLSSCFLSLCQDMSSSLSVLLVNPRQEQGQKLALYSVSTFIL